jgi:hypothetical protein
MVWASAHSTPASIRLRMRHSQRRSRVRAAVSRSGSVPAVPSAARASRLRAARERLRIAVAASAVRSGEPIAVT